MFAPCIGGKIRGKEEGTVKERKREGKQGRKESGEERWTLRELSDEAILEGMVSMKGLRGKELGRGDKARDSEDI